MRFCDRFKKLFLLKKLRKEEEGERDADENK